MHHFALVLLIAAWIVPPLSARPQFSLSEIVRILDGLHKQPKYQEGTCGLSRFGEPSNSDYRRIVGGKEARLGEWPWQVSVGLDGGHGCGGTLVAKQWVVTAAHCVHGRPKINITVVVGEHDTQVRNNPNRQVFYNLGVHVHPKYNDMNLENDIALLKLPEPGIEFNEFIRPACLPKAGDDFEGELCVISGWGTTKWKGTPSPVLKSAEVLILSNSKCQKSYGAAGMQVFDTQLCAGYWEGGTDTCQGDSGGPLVCESNGDWTLAGVVSWGFECALPTFPGVYARVVSFLPWIEATMKNADQTS